MTAREWIERARDNAVVLEELIQDWHPASREYDSEAAASMPITDRAAQYACDVFSARIANKAENGNPRERFLTAIRLGDCETAY